MALSSRRSHCESLSGSSDECKTVPKFRGGDTGVYFLNLIFISRYLWIGGVCIA